MTKDAEKKTSVSADSNVIRISNNHPPGFYLRAATNFLHGVTGKDGVDKPVFDEIIVSALGGAISTVAQVCGTLEDQKVGTIVRTETAYVQLQYDRLPQIQCTVKRNPDYVVPPREERVKGKKGASAEREKFAAGPETPERLKDPSQEKKMKKVIKEGGKRGVEIEGSHDMGGTKWFCTRVEECGTDVEMLVECVKAMNAKCDENAEERKGGSHMVAKAVTSNAPKDDNNVAICCYVPASAKEFPNDFTADTWLKELLKKLDVPSDNQEPFKWHVANPVYSAIQIKNNESKNVFCVKLKDYLQQRANDILIERGLIPPFADSDSDDMCYGDDDMAGF